MMDGQKNIKNTHNIQNLLLFHGNNGYANAFPYFLIHAFSLVHNGTRRYSPVPRGDVHRLQIPLLPQQHVEHTDAALFSRSVLSAAICSLQAGLSQ